MMSTDELLYPGLTLTLGVDGRRAVELLDDNSCCSDPVCITEQEAACSIVDLLPSGPMWDRQKAEVRHRISDEGGVPLPGSPNAFAYPSMVTYAVYMGQVLADMVTTILQPVVREAFPHTAVDTLDDWLNRYDWVDCYRSACRASHVVQYSPYETETDCGSEYFATDFSDDFERALKHAILQCLVRAQRGFIKNLDGINWVIAPLGAVVGPVYSAFVQDYIDSGETCPSCFCEEVQLEITNTGEPTLPGAPTVDSMCGEAPATVDAEQTYIDGAGGAVQVFPGVLAAECIVRALMQRQCPNIVNRTVSPVVVPAPTLVYTPAGDPVGYLLGRTSYNNGVGGSTKGAIFTANNRRFLTGVNFSVPVGPNMHVFVAELDAANNITNVLLDSPEVVGYTSGSYHYTLPAPLLLEPGTRFMVASYRADDATLTHRHGPNDTDPNGHFTPDPTNRIDGLAADRIVGGNLEAALSAGRPFGVHLTSETANLVP